MPRSFRLLVLVAWNQSIQSDDPGSWREAECESCTTRRRGSKSRAWRRACQRVDRMPQSRHRTVAGTPSDMRNRAVVLTQLNAEFARDVCGGGESIVAQRLIQQLGALRDVGALFDQRPIAALHLAGPSAGKFHHRLVPTNFSDVAQGCDREIVVRLIEGTASSRREREQLRGRPGHVAWLDRTALFHRFGETSLDQRIQMPAYCGTRQSEGNCQRTRGRGTRFEEDSGDASRCPGQARGWRRISQPPLCPISS